jgi:hypothetical protein
MATRHASDGPESGRKYGLEWPIFLQSVLQNVIAQGQVASPGCECGALSPFTRRCTVFLPSASKSHDQE